MIARSVNAEAVTVRRCVDIGGPVPGPAPVAVLRAAVLEERAEAPVAAPLAEPEQSPFARLPAAPEPLPPPRVAPAEPVVMGRLIPMPCLVAGGATSAAPRTSGEPPSSATFIVTAAPPSAPLQTIERAAIESSPLAPLESAPFAPIEAPPPSTIDPMAQTEPEIPFVSAQLVVMAPARRARPEPELPGVVVRPSLLLTPEQLAHDDTTALLMLTPPDVAEFCMPPRTHDPSAPTLPPLSTRTVPLSVFSARTMPVPVHPPAAEVRKPPTRVIAALGLAVVLVFAFVAGLLVTTAVVVTINPTHCR